MPSAAAAAGGTWRRRRDEARRRALRGAWDALRGRRLRLDPRGLTHSYLFTFYLYVNSFK